MVSNEYKIEDIPVSRRRYPFDYMKVGQSFALSANELVKVRSAASTYGKRHGKTFAVVKQTDGTYRCGRVE
jgi:hypothetical protein